MPRSFAAPPPAKFGASATRGTPMISKVMTSTAPSTKTWTVSEPAALPVFHILEKTHAKVNAPAQVVADRICECLRVLNIAADASHMEDVEEERNILRAETRDYVKFSVRLFSGNQGIVVVEVQRRCGCSYSFREASRAVLHAAKDDSAPPCIPPLPPKRNLATPPYIPERTAEARQSCVQDDFEIALGMLLSERTDSQDLALDSLECMTQSCGAVDQLAKSILREECLQRLVALLEVADEEEDSQCARKVMAVLANSFAALGPGDLAEVLVSASNLKEGSFLAILCCSLRDAAEKPHDACQAARCLQALLISNEVKANIMEMRQLMEVVESACSAGCNSHRALEQESRKLMEQLRKVSSC
ncbi:MAG: hypothetical protein SGILL_001351 [Bacillariaceae sp.]